MQLYKQVLIF